MIPKKSDKMIYIIFGAAIYILGLLLGLHAGKIMDSGEPSIINAFIEALSVITSNPMDFGPVSSNGLICCGLVTFIAFFAFMSFYIDQERKKNTMQLWRLSRRLTPRDSRCW